MKKINVVLMKTDDQDDGGNVVSVKALQRYNGSRIPIRKTATSKRSIGLAQLEFCKATKTMPACLVAKGEIPDEYDPNVMFFKVDMDSENTVKTKDKKITEIDTISWSIILSN